MTARPPAPSRPVAWRPTWPGPPLALPPGEAHLWQTAPDAPAGADLLAAYDALLSPAERARNRRFVFERHRRQDLVTRALVRTVLSTYCPTVEPAAWEFAAGPFGRPFVAGPMAQTGLSFNLSHTDGMIVCLVAAEREIGVDVEDTARNSATVEIADRYFSSDEVHRLRRLPLAAQPSRFFDIWTLKEAYIKARGLGLHLPLDQFTLSLQEGGPGHVNGPNGPCIGISFGPGIEDDPASWQLRILSLTARHRCAVAIRRQTHDLVLRRFTTTPLLDGRPAQPAGTTGADSHVCVS
ncbi:MAG: 4'-phosphopantetheinyl transferase superfamily protein [Chloroflexi bacterium]|nr:4'-phosphopantetheinyl transferase superfamily protein [Chloroflexota bacterium]